MRYSILIAALLSMTLTSCGWFDRKVSALTGGASEVCVGGVTYLQFTSGTSVKYNRDGTVAPCQ